MIGWFSELSEGGEGELSTGEGGTEHQVVG